MLLFASSVFVLSVSFLLHPVAFTARGADCLTPPPNMQVEAELRPIILQMLARSRTLRGQCRRIAVSPATRVRIAISTAPMEGGARARSVARRFASGRLIVDVQLPPASHDFAELLAHELEHVIEFIDGVDFRALAATRRSAIERQSDGSFESDRARNAGIAAAAEVAAAGGGGLMRPWRAVARFARAALRR